MIEHTPQNWIRRLFANLTIFLVAAAAATCAAADTLTLTWTLPDHQTVTVTQEGSGPGGKLTNSDISHAFNESNMQMSNINTFYMGNHDITRQIQELEDKAYQAQNAVDAASGGITAEVAGAAAFAAGVLAVATSGSNNTTATTGTTTTP